MTANYWVTFAWRAHPQHGGSTQMVDQVLKGLFGGQDTDDDAGRRARARDFVNRYEQGAPSEGYGEDEVLRNYHTVTDRLSPQEYEEAANSSFSRLSPEERRRLRRAM